MNLAGSNLSIDLETRMRRGGILSTLLRVWGYQTLHLDRFTGSKMSPFFY